MKEKGYTYHHQEHIGGSRSVATSINGDAVLTGGDELTYGYLRTYSDSVLEEPEDSGYRLALAGDSSEQEKVITYKLNSGAIIGMTTDSCTSYATQAVYGSIENGLKYTNLTNELLDVGSKTGANEEIGVLYRSNKEYPQCMNQAGYPDVKTFGDAPKVAEQKFGHYRAPGTPANAEERAMAQADYTCQESSGIVRKAEDIFYSKAGQWLKDHEALIMEIRDIEKVAKERAVHIINS
ncbi:MAG: adenylate cyclase [Rothia sp. (in: high G+C Gram-positive bacteria)]|uniref:adenylate cyclase n=1 Tax=Rothia sp. (in: high G+C Gram-positive bacteria) TaxID=1885016 RepID=UPI0026DF437D|nr:adenylate cyclase [Rothia sp. (in: high G+C Gram-positive bacteria)]MDO5749745.1 adenylate cyclase [Rothia sp. (in: high G+C Gram-positive bacteria)]